MNNMSFMLNSHKLLLNLRRPNKLSRAVGWCFAESTRRRCRLCVFFTSRDETDAGRKSPKRPKRREGKQKINK